MMPKGRLEREKSESEGMDSQDLSGGMRETTREAKHVGKCDRIGTTSDISLCTVGGDDCDFRDGLRISTAQHRRCQCQSQGEGHLCVCAAQWVGGG